MAVLPKQLIQYFNETPSIKTESLHFNHILTVKKSSMPMQILMDTTTLAKQAL